VFDDSFVCQEMVADEVVTEEEVIEGIVGGVVSTTGGGIGMFVLILNPAMPIMLANAVAVPVLAYVPTEETIFS